MAQRESPKDPVRIQLSKVDKEMGAERMGDDEAQGAKMSEGERRVSKARDLDHSLSSAMQSSLDFSPTCSGESSPRIHRAE